MDEHRLITLSEYQPRATQWLWPNLIPFGGITLVDGDPGRNKSSLICDITARITNGKPMYGCGARPSSGTVILLQGEDTLDRVCQNLNAAGADLSKVFVWKKTPTVETTLTLPDDLEFIARETRSKRAKLIVFDPITSFLSVNINNDQSVRRALQPLALLAEQTGAALLLVRHLTKSGGTNPLYRGGGSVGFIAACRSGLLVASDPGNLDQRVLAQTKSSLGPISTSLSFRPVSRGDGVAIEWLGTSDYEAAQLLEAGRSQSRPELEEAIYVLYSILAEGSVEAKEAKQMAAEAGVAYRTLRRAKEILKVQSKRQGFGPGSVFSWVLPKEHEIVARLRERDLDELAHKLFHGEACEDRISEFGSDATDGKSQTNKKKPDDDEPDAASSPSGE